MMLPLVLAAALFCAGARAAEPEGKYALCRENPQLERAAFLGEVVWEKGRAPQTWTFTFDHCAVSGRDKSRPMEVQRYYRAKEGGQGLSLTTQLGSLITSARLVSNDRGFGGRSGAGQWEAELGPFFTADLLGGGAVDAGLLNKKGALTLRVLKPVP